MRIGEALIIPAALAATGALLFAREIGAGRTPAIALAVAAVGLAAMLHVRGPFRWQMLPIEALILAVVVLAMAGVQPDGVARIVTAGLALAAAALTTVLAVGLPLVKLPAPSGPFAVGATTLELVRPASEAGGSDRRLLIKVWHPAPDAPTELTEPLWREIRASGTPPPLRFLLRYLDGVATHTHANAPLRTDGAPYPLVIYNHALVSHPSENTLLMETLASAGYVVVSVSHVDQAAEHAALARAIPAEERARDKTLYAAFQAAPDRTERARIMAEIYANSSATAEIVRRRTADTAFVLDEIETVLAAIPGGGGAMVSDLDRIGALGFSLGGAVATRWCMTDPRCRAAVNLDGGAFGAPEDAALGVPYLMIYAEATEGANDALKARATGAFEEETLAGARHMDFTDATAIWPLLKSLGALGSTAGLEMARRKNERVRMFLETHLKSIDFSPPFPAEL